MAKQKGEKSPGERGAWYSGLLGFSAPVYTKIKSRSNAAITREMVCVLRELKYIGIMAYPNLNISILKLSILKLSIRGLSNGKIVQRTSVG